MLLAAHIGVSDMVSLALAWAFVGLRAVRSAVAMRREMVKRSQVRIPRLAVRIGIHTGEAVVGNIGASVLMNYTAIGDTVNLTKRLEEACQPHQILITADTCHRLEGAATEFGGVNFVSLGLRQFKGRKNSVEVFSVEEPECAPV